MALRQTPCISNGTTHPITSSTLGNALVEADISTNAISLSDTAMVIEQVGSRVFNFSDNIETPRVTNRIANKGIHNHQERPTTNSNSVGAAITVCNRTGSSSSMGDTDDHGTDAVLNRAENSSLGHS